MTATVINFIPRPNPNRPTLLETKEHECEEFAAKAPALFPTDCGQIGWPWDEKDKA